MIEPTSPPRFSQSQPFFAMATAVSGSPVEKPTYLLLRCAASMIFVTAASTFGSKLSYGAVGSDPG